MLVLEEDFIVFRYPVTDLLLEIGDVLVGYPAGDRKPGSPFFCWVLARTGHVRFNGTRSAVDPCLDPFVQMRIDDSPDGVVFHSKDLMTKGDQTRFVVDTMRNVKFDLSDAVVSHFLLIIFFGQVLQFIIANGNGCKLFAQPEQLF